MTDDSSKKSKLSVTVDLHLDEEIVRHVDSNEFSSKSSLTSAALYSFFARLDQQKDIETMMDRIASIEIELQEIKKKVNGKK